jgi:hypothetical protein
MSKRFGRNQKRKMRQEIAAREIEHIEILNVLTASYSDRLGESKKLLKAAEEVLNSIRHEVSAASALFPAKDQRVNFNGMSSFTWAVLDRPMSLSVSNATSSMTSLSGFHHVLMHLLETKVVKDKFSTNLHMLVRLADKKVAYAIAGNALNDMTRNTLHQIIVPQLTATLIEDIKKEGVRI